MYFIKKRENVLLTLLIVFLMSGCFGGKSEDEYLSLAKTSIENKEFNAAIINLKNVVLINGQNAEARFLLGKSYLNLGLWVSAEKELELAYGYGYDLSQVIPLLSKSYYHLGDIKGLEDLVVQVDLLPEETQTILKTFVAITFIKEEYFDQGLNYLHEVVERNTDSKYTRLSKAWQYGLNSDLPQALGIIDTILSETPGFVEAIEYKAYLLFKKQDMEESASFFKQYITIHPQAHELRMMYALALVYSENYIEAEKQVDLLLSGMPNSAKLNEIKAQTRFANNDYKKAKQYAETALRENTTLVLAKVLAGISSYQLKQFEAAYSHLHSVKDNLGYQHPARKLLNELRFKMGYEDELFNELSNVPNDSVDIDTLGISAVELFKIGKSNEANALLAKAASKEPNNANVLYQQGLFRLSNDDSSASEFFERAIESNPELESAISMLLLEQLKRENYDKAFEIANDAGKTNPELGLTYQGIIYARKGDLLKAKESFNKALTMNPLNAGVSFKLGQVYQLEGSIDLAITHYQNALKSNLSYPLAVSALLKISVDPVYKTQIKVFFEELIQNNQAKYVSYIYLVSFHVVDKQLKAAELVVNKALDEIPNNLNLLIYKGKIQANAKDLDSALMTFDEVLKLAPNSVDVLLFKAGVFELKGELGKAIEQQEAALKLRPTSLELKLDLVNLYIKQGDTSKASNVLEELLLLGKNNTRIQMLRGKVAFLNKDYKKTEIILKPLFEKIKAEEITLELATSLQKLNRSEEALQVIERYKTSIKGRVELDILLKQAELLEQVDPSQSLAIYNDILNKSNRHFVLLNNIAMVYLQLENPKQALIFAEEAFKKSEENTTVQNTFGLALLASQDVVKAEKHLKQTFLKNQNNDNYKVHYAMALAANNKTEESNALLMVINKNSLNPYSLKMYQDLAK